MRPDRFLLVIGMGCLVPACASNEDWVESQSYENCAVVSVPGYSPDEMQEYVIDVIKPAFANKPSVASFQSQAGAGTARICVGWSDVRQRFADDELRSRLFDLRADLPMELTDIRFETGTADP